LKFAKFSIIVVGTLVVIVSIAHYQPVFAKFEHAGWINLVSWLMGIIFDLPGLLLLYFYVQIPAKSKHVIGSLLLLLIAFFHWVYYTQTVPDILTRLVLSAVWPVMIIVVTFVAYQIRKIESEKAKAKAEPEPEKAEEEAKPDGILTFLGVPKKQTAPPLAKKKRQTLDRETRSTKNMKSGPTPTGAPTAKKNTGGSTDSMRTDGGSAKEVKNEKKE